MENKKRESRLELIKNTRNALLLWLCLFCFSFVVTLPHEYLYLNPTNSLKENTIGSSIINFDRFYNTDQQNRQFSYWAYPLKYKPTPLHQNIEGNIRRKAWRNHRKQVYRILYNH